MRGILRRRHSRRALVALGPDAGAESGKELAATFQRAATDILDVAEVMPAEKYGFKPTPEISSFGDQLVHVGGITQRFIDTAKGTKTEAAHHGAMAKPEIIDLLKKTFQSAQDVISRLTDAQLVEPVKFRSATARSPGHILAGPAVPDPQPLWPARGLPADERDCAADERAAVGFASLTRARPRAGRLRPGDGSGPIRPVFARGGAQEQIATHTPAALV